ncbi:GspH/FimT family pseudopilin [Undibacterium fentianense]|uniref:Type II secretion system protein H n=1 Tax=Undibacterium fentianense TaxID=2828728 RepID=A0A941IFT9_9BURK|nr:GspH/FimT family pseudopilin [Undibacterium fentianense]MBR7801076.1 GspH/FimT family pseudopilin [Undibacterium fentianense]
MQKNNKKNSKNVFNYIVVLVCVFISIFFDNFSFSSNIKKGNIMENQRNQYYKGMTLTELIISLFLVSVLSQIALASYSNLVARMRIYTASSTLHAALLYARSEALKRGGGVIICRSTNADGNSASCDAAAATGASAEWGDGWIIFHDRNQDGKYSTEDEILQVHGKVFQSSTVGSINSSPIRKQIKFNNLGQVYGTFLEFSIVAPEGKLDPSYFRYICIASGGRARIDKQECAQK